MVKNYTQSEPPSPWCTFSVVRTSCELISSSKLMAFVLAFTSGQDIPMDFFFVCFFLFYIYSHICLFPKYKVKIMIVW